jgi:large subunit ribosomal protein L25
MTVTQAMKASARPKAGKGAARATRRSGRVPGVIYGEKQPPVSISVDAMEITTRIHAGHFMTTVYDLDVDGQKQRVIPRGFQLDPVRDHPIHVDFQRISPGSHVRVHVPVQFTNVEAAPGIKRGGTLNIVRHTIELLCPAEAIPQSIVADVGELDIGKSLHISAIKLPEGTRAVVRERDFTVATVVASSGYLEELAAAAVAAAAAAVAAAAAAEAALAAGEEGVVPAPGAPGEAAAAPAAEAAPAAGAKPAPGAAPAAPAKKPEKK